MQAVKFSAVITHCSRIHIQVISVWASMMGDIFSLPATSTQRAFFFCCTVHIFYIPVFPTSGESLCLSKESSVKRVNDWALCVKKNKQNYNIDINNCKWRLLYKCLSSNFWSFYPAICFIYIYIWNWYILIQELKVIWRPNRKNKWSSFYLIKKIKKQMKYGLGREGDLNFVGFSKFSLEIFHYFFVLTYRSNIF